MSTCRSSSLAPIGSEPCITSASRQEPNRDALVLYAGFIGDTADYLLNPLVDITIGNEWAFLKGAPRRLPVSLWHNTWRDPVEDAGGSCRVSLSRRARGSFSSSLASSIVRPRTHTSDFRDLNSWQASCLQEAPPWRLKNASVSNSMRPATFVQRLLGSARYERLPVRQS